MGKGDKKSKRGKIILGSFGVRRRKKAGKNVPPSLPKGTVKQENTSAAATPAEVKAPKPARTVKPRTAEKPAAKPAAKKSAAEQGEVSEKAARPAARAKKTTTGKEGE
jgi:ribosomal small subunit protein bTHX